MAKIVEKGKTVWFLKPTLEQPVDIKQVETWLEFHECRCPECGGLLLDIEHEDNWTGDSRVGHKIRRIGKQQLIMVGCIGCGVKQPLAYIVQEVANHGKRRYS